MIGPAVTAWAVDGRGWHVRRDGSGFALTRRLPLRWDVEARAAMPDLGRRRLAHAVRQDLWRLLHDLRGFAPAVEVMRVPAGCAVRAGGGVAGAVPAGTGDRIEAMLHDPYRRAAWIRAAAHQQAA